MNLNQLKVFCEVVERKGFTRAAEALYLTQPAVSRQVQELERTYGVELFEQIGKRIYPTEAGTILYNYAKTIFHTLDDLGVELNHLKGLKSGHLRIAASATAGTYLLPPLLGKFKRKYPGVEVSLEIYNSQQVEQRLLLYQQLDLGVTERPVTEESLYFESFDTDQLMVIVSPDHPLADRGTISATDLQGERFILREVGSGTRALLEEEFARLNLRVRRVMELGSTAAVKQAVAAGLGVSVVSSRSIQLEMGAGLLRALHCPDMRLVREIHYVHHRHKRLSHAATAFLQILKKAFPEVPEEAKNVTPAV
ncbi:MAG: selenium metabolism-associated LysR family transcriptional regulator [Sphingomonadaceae bacterium]